MTTPTAALAALEFPELTEATRIVLKDALNASDRWFFSEAFIASFEKNHLSREDRRFLAAFMRAAMKQAGPPEISALMKWDFLADMHRNLHSPPPTPPTLAQAREAARQLGGANAEVVHAFLATLGETKL